MDLKEIKIQRTQSYFFLVLNIAHILYFLSTGQMTMFYVVYLFWFEELIRYFFEMYYYSENKHKIERYHSFDRFKSARLGFLFVLWFLIYPIYGKMFVTDAEDYTFNKQIVHFESVWFNSYLLLNVLRAFVFWRKQLKIARNQEKVFIDYSENGIWIMTLSIIVSTWIGLSYLDDLTNQAVIVIAIPFITLKALIEFNVIRLHYKKVKQLIQDKEQNLAENK